MGRRRTIHIDERLVARLVGTHGDAGHRFVSALPDTLEHVTRLWDLDVGDPWPASYAFVVPAQRRLGGEELVLKLRVPGREAQAEAAALRWFDGAGAVRLIAMHPEHGALLLERVRPGTDLANVTEDAAVDAAVQVIRRLTTSARAGPLPDLPTVQDWCNGFRRSGSDIPEASEAETLFRALCATSGPGIVLHGDLHHGNLIGDRDEWRAIDPHGVIGEPEYEVGAFVRNPLPWIATAPDAPARIARRLDRFARELGFDRGRIHAWAYAQAVLAACWDVEDGDHPDTSLHVAAAIGFPRDYSVS